MRPLDLLERSIGKRVIVLTKNQCTFSGTLVAYDLHLNTWIGEATVSKDDITVDYGDLVIRGDVIVFISPDTKEVE